jgi:hypothetical protein
LDERAEIPVIRKLKLEVFGNYFLPHRHRPYREKQTALFFMNLGKGEDDFTLIAAM